MSTTDHISNQTPTLIIHIFPEHLYGAFSMGSVLICNPSGQIIGQILIDNKEFRKDYEHYHNYYPLKEIPFKNIVDDLLEHNNLDDYLVDFMKLINNYIVDFVKMVENKSDKLEDMLFTINISSFISNILSHVKSVYPDKKIPEKYLNSKNSKIIVKVDDFKVWYM